MNVPRISALCAALAMLLMLLSAPVSPASGAFCDGASGENKAAPALTPDGSAVHETLFPGLDHSRILAVSVKTPDRSFEFQCDPQAREVSVNGHVADEEVFSTLVSQIQELPVDDMPSFSPEHTPLLTLVVFTADGARHTARFYADGGSGAQTHIASGPESAPVYHRTEAWRVGTLMMTCEGTRIQDARGNETPAD